MMTISTPAIVAGHHKAQGHLLTGTPRVPMKPFRLIVVSHPHDAIVHQSLVPTASGHFTVTSSPGNTLKQLQATPDTSAHVRFYHYHSFSPDWALLSRSHPAEVTTALLSRASIPIRWETATEYQWTRELQAGVPT
jgi:hypothetical protein